MPHARTSSGTSRDFSSAYGYFVPPTVNLEDADSRSITSIPIVSAFISSYLQTERYNDNPGLQSC
jgi:hypothetical protein